MVIPPVPINSALGSVREGSLISPATKVISSQPPMVHDTAIKAMPNPTMRVPKSIWTAWNSIWISRSPKSNWTAWIEQPDLLKSYDYQIPKIGFAQKVRFEPAAENRFSNRFEICNKILKIHKNALNNLEMWMFDTWYHAHNKNGYN